MKAFYFIAAILVSQFAFGSVIDVKNLNQILKKSQAGWVAKTTPISQLTPDEAKRMMGLRRDTSGVDFKNSQFTPRAGLPVSLDWRDQLGSNWVSPILDQGNCGSCVAFAAIGALETQYKIASGFAAFNVKLSPQHLFSCGGGACDYGWMPATAAGFLQSHGVPEEACSPYISGATGKDVACSASCSDASRRSLRITGYSTPTRSVQDLNSVKQALQNGPLVTTLEVYADFMAYSSGVYKHVQGDIQGGHAVSIVGYDDNSRSFIIRNSWGQSWGENGFAHVSYDDVSGIGDETWFYQMPSLNGGVSVEGPLDYSYAAGQVPLKSDSTYGGTDSLAVSLFDVSGKAVWTTNCPGKACNQAVDVSTWDDGRYEVQATAMDSAGHSLGSSTRQFFYVANQKPSLSLSFSGANGTDLNKSLSDRIEVNVTAISSSVPMSSVEFHYRGPDGKEVLRVASVVVNGMTMGWRTNLVPNGAYELWMIGRVKTNSTETVIETPHKTVVVAN